MSSVSPLSLVRSTGTPASRYAARSSARPARARSKTRPASSMTAGSMGASTSRSLGASAMVGDLELVQGAPPQRGQLRGAQGVAAAVPVQRPPVPPVPDPAGHHPLAGPAQTQPGAVPGQRPGADDGALPGPPEPPPPADPAAVEDVQRRAAEPGPQHAQPRVDAEDVEPVGRRRTALDAQPVPAAAGLPGEAAADHPREIARGYPPGQPGAQPVGL